MGGSCSCSFCYGWIYSTVKRLDDEKRLQLFTPRNTKSVWSKLNNIHIKDLMEGNLMHSSGLVKIDIAKKGGSWSAFG